MSDILDTANQTQGGFFSRVRSALDGFSDRMNGFLFQAEDQRIDQASLWQNLPEPLAETPAVELPSRIVSRSLWQSSEEGVEYRTSIADNVSPLVQPGLSPEPRQYFSGVEIERDGVMSGPDWYGPFNTEGEAHQALDRVIEHELFNDVGQQQMFGRDGVTIPPFEQTVNPDLTNPAILDPRQQSMSVQDEQILQARQDWAMAVQEIDGSDRSPAVKGEEVAGLGEPPGMTSSAQVAQDGALTTQTDRVEMVQEVADRDIDRELTQDRNLEHEIGGWEL